MTRNTHHDLTRLTALVYSSGKVFNGLNTSRLDTEEFLRTGDTTNVTSRADLELLNDLRDAARFILDHPKPHIDAAFVCAVNACLTRSAALHPGRLRTATERIGVTTIFGRHEPPAITEPELNDLLSRALAPQDHRAQAINLFITLAKAQPFGDGNKRTALFVANAVTIWATPPETLLAPVSDNDPSVAARFNTAIAHAYMHNDHSHVAALLHADGFAPIMKPSTHNHNNDPFAPHTPGASPSHGPDFTR